MVATMSSFYNAIFSLIRKPVKEDKNEKENEENYFTWCSNGYDAFTSSL